MKKKTQKPIERARIKALDTHYRGFKCRSRAEARWLCFFDHIGISFEYEPQGFELEDGTKYLPDLYLPQVRLFAEVKPTYLTDRETNKCKMLASGTGLECLFLDGNPDFKKYDAVTWDAGDFTICEYVLDTAMYKRYYTEEHRFFCNPGYGFDSEDHFSEPYKEAVYASRAIRFDGKDE